MGKPTANDEWWRKRYARLREKASRVEDVEPDTAYPKNGMWPAIKLVWMDYALGIYAPIMRRQREQRNFDTLHFIDLCAGSGLTTVETATRAPELIAGSALIGACDPSFDAYHFVEPHKKAAAVLEKRVSKVLPTGRFRVYCEPRADAVVKIVDRISSESARPHYLAFVDPEGFTEITLPQLKPLFSMSRGDFIFNFQHTGAKRAPPAAAAFLGRPELEHRLGSMSPDDIIAVFLDQLRSYGRPEVAWIPVETGTNAYAYGVVYAAVQTRRQNEWLQNFRSDVHRRMQGIDGANLANILGGQRRLDSPSGEGGPRSKQSKLFD